MKYALFALAAGGAALIVFPKAVVPTSILGGNLSDSDANVARFVGAVATAFAVWRLWR